MGSVRGTRSLSRPFSFTPWVGMRTSFGGAQITNTMVSDSSPPRSSFSFSLVNEEARLPKGTVRLRSTWMGSWVAGEGKYGKMKVVPYDPFRKPIPTAGDLLHLVAMATGPCGICLRRRRTGEKGAPSA